MVNVNLKTIHGPTLHSEFGDELLVSDSYRKLVMTRGGEPLWATNFRKDPAEQINIIDGQQGFLDHGINYTKEDVST